MLNIIKIINLKLVQKFRFIYLVFINTVKKEDEKLQGKDMVSIIIPMYNAGKSIEHCLKSLINQTYDNIEIILVNDGSTDNTQKICQDYKTKHKNIILLNQENSGPSVARNKGIEVSNGRYIQFVDSDDFIDKQMTYKLVSEMSNEISLVICGLKTFYLDAGEKKVINWESDYCGIMEKKIFLEAFWSYYENRLINSPCNKLYISDIIKSKNIYFKPKEFMGEDLLFNLEYINQCKRINIINDTLYNYITFNSDSLTRSYKKNLFENQKMLLEEIIRFLIENNAFNPKNKSIINKQYIKSIISCFENIINLGNNLNFKNKITEIKYIMKDKTVDNALKNIDITDLKLQDNIVIKLLEKKHPYGLFYFFILKGFVRNYFQPIFRKLKDFNK